jgi:glycosyltransferase involved in cell wall biosynthesis
MNILSFGTEQKLFDQESRVYKRIFGYSFSAEKYYHFVFTKDFTARRREDQNMIVVPVYGRSRITQILRLSSLLQKENIKRNNLVVSAQDPFEIGFIAVIIAKLYRAKLLVQMHSDISTDSYKRESLRNRFQARVAKFVFTKADRIRVVSGRMKKFLVRELKIQEEKVTLLPIFSVLNTTYLEPKKDTKTLVMLCRVEKVKQIPLAVEAVGILREKTNIDYRLRIVGEGSQKKKLQEGHSSLRWVEWVTFTENVQNEYQSACCSLITSLYEGFAMTAIESISFGTPVAMTDVGCADDVVKEGVNGSIAKDFTGEGVAQAIIRTLNSNYAAEDLRESLKILGTEEEYLQKIKQLHTF